MIPLRAQNAILILRMAEDAVQCECFENSPTSSDVLAARGSLVRHFPAHAVTIAMSTFANNGFQKALTAKLCLLDSESIKSMPQAVKGAQSTAQGADPPDPRLVTDMLMAILAAVGSPVSVARVTKRTRDDVVCHGALQPWRRSFLWLAIRVTIETTLLDTMNAGSAIAQYKNYMIFFITELLSRALQAGLARDLCQTILVKIARRSAKLGERLIQFVQIKAMNECRNANTELDTEWAQICQQDAQRITSLEVRSFDSDTKLSLTNSATYLTSILNRNLNTVDSTKGFSPSCPQYPVWEQDLPSLGELTTVREERIYALARFEHWISKSLGSWTISRLGAPKAQECMSLSNLADQYYTAAAPIYHGQPLQISHMILIILRMWYAMDQIASTLTPLFKSFSPEIEPTTFEPLLLPKYIQMQQLQEIEKYLSKRHEEAKEENLSIFSGPENCNSFTAQLYSTSSRHQALKKKIGTKAIAEQEEKAAELKEKTELYEARKNKIQSLSCEMTMDEDGREVHNPEECEKCQLNLQALAMTIDVFEWPLPRQSKVCSSIAIELDCPLQLAAWRNLTWLLVHDIGRKGGTSGNFPTTSISAYQGLKKYYKPSNSRLTLATTTKSIVEEHRGSAHFPAELDDVCVENTLVYELFDTQKTCWVGAQRETPSIYDHCTPTLPNGLYSRLQYTLGAVVHAQNTVIADQASCPRNLSLQEFISFGSLRADGERLQWLNIARELSASNLNLNAPEVCTLFCQAIWQVSSSADSVLRKAHLDVQAPTFALELLATVEERTSAVEGNWKSNHAVSLLIAVVLRVLSLASDDRVVQNALQSLGRFRDILQSWIQILGGLLSEPNPPKQVTYLGNSLLRSALLCKSTFDVDIQYKSRSVLTTKDITSWIYCSILVREHKPGDGQELPQDLRDMIIRDMKLSQSLCSTVKECILSDANESLDAAIGSVIADHVSRAGTWVALKSPNERWLCPASSGTATAASRTYHYNVLEGDLLFDGQSSGKLPFEYTSDKLYVRVFGSQVLPVRPAKISGMRYVTSQPINGHDIYFAIHEGALVIRSQNGSQYQELIPHEKFLGDLPLCLVDRYTHWLDLSTSEIEFRLLTSIWTQNPDAEDWHLRYRQHGPSQLIRASEKLIDICSGAFGAIMKVFAVLDDQDKVYATWSTQDQRLEVCLPRYDLHFTLLQSGEFLCKELDKVIDSDQAVGTFIGLKTRLVLCECGMLARKHERIVLVPEGKVSWSKAESHLEVKITIDGSSVRVFQYQIDLILQRLKDNGDPHQALYKAYLHAVTSYFLSDPLTQRTGTEEALLCLRQRSLSFLEPPHVKTAKLLTAIAKLTPRRKYYPPNLRLMQEVHWDMTLSMFSQHDEFIALAEVIMTSGNDFVDFYLNLKQPVSLSIACNAHLLDRSLIRNSVYRTSEEGRKKNLRCFEIIYNPRDRAGTDMRAARTFELGRLILTPSRALQVTVDLYEESKKYERMSGFNTKFSSSSSLTDLLDLSFAESWAPLQALFLTLDENADMYETLFLVGTIAYGIKNKDLTMLKTLLAFIYYPALRKIKISSKITYLQFSQGTEMKKLELRETVEAHMETPSRRGRKSAQRKAEEEAYQQKAPGEIERVARQYVAQWPCTEPKPPKDSSVMYLNVCAAHEAITRLFSLWNANKQYQKYCHKIQPILQNIRRGPTGAKYTYMSWHLVQPPVEARSSLEMPSLPELLSTNAAPSISDAPVAREDRKLLMHVKNVRLERLLDTVGLQGDYTGIRAQYRRLLKASYEALGEHKAPLTSETLPQSQAEVLLNRMACESHMRAVHKEIQDCLRPKPDSIGELLEICGMWPRLTICTLLKLLSSTSIVQLNSTWKICLLSLGHAVTMLQRARRLLMASERQDVAAFHTETENEGHDGWKMEDFPDWLLIEIENDLLIRPTQARVAQEMVEPSSGSNSLIQLNMGNYPSRLDL